MTITGLIILLTVIISWIAFSKPQVKEDLLFWPYQIKRQGQWYRFITHGALHADTLHLIFNMVSFYSFGAALEDYLFTFIFSEASRAMLAVLYITGIVFAVIPDYIKHRDNISHRSLGASGAVSAVVFAAITIQPTMPIMFFFIPFKIPGWAFGIAFLILSASLAKKGGGNIGHNAHFWGSIYGVLFTYLAAKLYANIDLLDNFITTVVK
jgi:membrane associated rhomboid family serine protease